MTKLFGAYVILSALTLLIAWELYKTGHLAAAIAVLIVSPFPCPGPAPC